MSNVSRLRNYKKSCEMGAWGHGHFENDGALEVLEQAKQSGADRLGWTAALERAFDAFETFLDRDSKGLTYRPISSEELAEQDRMVREALADIPSLVEEWDSGLEGEDTSDLVMDTGDYEAQGAVAAAALVLASSGAVTVKLPKKLKLPNHLAPDIQLVSRAKSALEALLSNRRLAGQFSTEWLAAVGRLAAAKPAC